MNSVLTKLLGGGIVACILIIIFQMFSIKSSHNTIKTMQHSLAELSTELDVSRQNLITCQNIAKLTIEAKERLQSELDSKRLIERDAIDELTKASVPLRGDKNETIDPSADLPADFIGVLSNTCNKVRGSACPNP